MTKLIIYKLLVVFEGVLGRLKGFIMVWGVAEGTRKRCGKRVWDRAIQS